VSFRRKHLISALLYTLLSSVFFISCNQKEENRIVLNDKFYWYETDSSSTIWNAMTSASRYLKLNDTKNGNLEKIVSGRTTYVWLKAEFTVPDSLKDMNLALEIPFVHFASETYINGISIGKAGRFPPKETSAFFSAHCYDIGRELINRDGNNTLYMKVFCMGKSTLGGKIFIGEPEDAKGFSNVLMFFRSTVYIFFEGLLFAVFLVFLMMYLARRKNAEYFSFAMMNFFTIFFLVTFFSGIVPVYDLLKHLKISYTLFIKIFLYMNLYIIVNFFVYFMFDFLGLKEKKEFKLLRSILLFVVSLVTFVMPNHEALQKITPYVLVYCSLNCFYGMAWVIKGFWNPEKKHDSILLAAGLFPLTVCGVLDFVVHVVIRSVYFPYFTWLGWFCVILMFISVLTHRFSRTSIQNEYLNKKLKEEVKLQTKNLTIANENLAKEIVRAQQDLEMASIVQKKYFPEPKMMFRGWDFAIDYEPLASVSGDLYDYYYNEGNLHGFALFDVSGHGLSASLITMLAKNIIGSSFERGEKIQETISDTLLSINDKIINEKGDIDNYLTGILLKFSRFDENDCCNVAMANAGHPYPILFRKEDESVTALKHDSTQKQYGAIGIQGIDVSFPAINFPMAQGDILVCYTDGLCEAADAAKEQFGYERIGKVVQENSHKSATEILRALEGAVENFSGGTPRDDDRTIIVLKRENSNNFVEQLEQLEAEDELEEL